MSDSADEEEVIPYTVELFYSKKEVRAKHGPYAEYLPVATDVSYHRDSPSVIAFISSFNFDLFFACMDKESFQQRKCTYFGQIYTDPIQHNINHEYFW